MYNVGALFIEHGGGGTEDLAFTSCHFHFSLFSLSTGVVADSDAPMQKNVQKCRKIVFRNVGATRFVEPSSGEHH